MSELFDDGAEYEELQDLRSQLSTALRERDEAVIRGEEFRDKWQDSNAARAKAERERDEAREWVRKLIREERVLTCIYCGHAYPPGSPTHGAEVLTAHAMVCKKHPLATAVEALEFYAETWPSSSTYTWDRARAALAAIRGTEGK